MTGVTERQEGDPGDRDVIMFFHDGRLCGGTLKEISDVMVKPCVMTGSSSAVRPFHTSSSTQRQPASSTCRYISTEELPASWPAAAWQ